MKLTDGLHRALSVPVDRGVATVQTGAVELVQRAAEQLLDPRPVPGTPEWAQADPDALVERDIAWQLLCLRIALASGVDPVGFLVGLRRWGATWQLIGAAAGMSRQAAHEKWADAVAGVLDPYGTGEIGAALHAD